MAPLVAPVKTLISRTNPERGFTLVELLVVLAIASMLIAVMPVAFNKLHEGSQYRDTVRSIVTDLRQARQQAATEGRNVSFQLDTQARQFGIQGRSQHLLPPSLEVRTTTGELADTAPQALATVIFMPGGGATGGTIELVRASGAGVRIRIDWLTGQITQEPRLP